MEIAVQIDNLCAARNCGTCESNLQTSHNGKTGTCKQTHAFPQNQLKKSNLSFQIAHEWLKRSSTSCKSDQNITSGHFHHRQRPAQNHKPMPRKPTNKNQPQQTLNDHAINTQSALLRVEWVPWDSRTHDRKQWVKCHEPNMGKTRPSWKMLKFEKKHLLHIHRKWWTSPPREVLHR